MMWQLKNNEVMMIIWKLDNDNDIQQLNNDDMMIKMWWLDNKTMTAKWWG